MTSVASTTSALSGGGGGGSDGSNTPSPISTPPTGVSSPSLTSNTTPSLSASNGTTTSSMGYTTSKLTTLHIEEIQGRNINEKDTFVKFKVDGKKYKTKAHKKTANPFWTDKFTVATTNKLEEITFNVISQNILGNNVKLGQVKYSLIKGSYGGLSTNSSSPIYNRRSKNYGNNQLIPDTVSITSSPNLNNNGNSTPLNQNNNHSGTPISTTPPLFPHSSNKPSQPPQNNNNNGSNNTHHSDTASLSEAYDSWTIEQWMPIEKERKDHHGDKPHSELKMKIIVKIRDIYLDSDTNSGTSATDEGTVTPVPPSKNGVKEIKDPKELSFIGKGGNQIKKFTKRLASKIEGSGSSSSSNGGASGGNSGSNSPTNQMSHGMSLGGGPTNGNNNGHSVNSPNTNKVISDKTRGINLQQQQLIEEQVAKERQKELEREAVEKEKERLREKLRQKEEEEIQKQMEKQRQEERRKAKEAKLKKDKENQFVPTHPIDYFFVCGCSSKLEPIDQKYDISSKSNDPLDIVYKGELLDCHPPKNDDVLPNHIWMYCFPRGVQLQSEEQAPSFFPFVLTNETGVRFYGSCLMFYEPIGDEISNEIRKRRNSLNPIIFEEQANESKDNDNGGIGSGGSGGSGNSKDGGSSKDTSQNGINSNVQLNKLKRISSPPMQSQNQKNESGSNQPGSQTLYTPKCICFLSHYPFYSFFRICLNEIYQKVFFSTTPLPIERLIYNMVSEVPLPIQGQTNVTYTVNSSLLSLKRPSEYLLPMFDLPFSLLFKCLDIKNALQLFRCILLEEKIVIISSHYSLLTYITEILTALIHPFTWPHVYVPILPELLLEYVYSPFPFIMGIHRSYSHNILNEENLLGEIVVADLDNNIVLVPPQIDSTHRQSISLPERETTQLINQLRKVVQYEILSSDLPNFNLNTLSPINPSFSSDSSRRMTNQHNSQIYHQPPPIPTHVDEHIRLSFLQFFCNILPDYRKHLKYLRVFPKPITLFNKSEFIKSKNNQNSIPFYSAFVETQAFSYFLDQHNWPTRNLFDYLLESQKYKKPLDELVSQYQSIIPQALGVLDEKKQNTLATPAPSALKTSANTIREYTKFPALKHDLMNPTSVPPSNSYLIQVNKSTGSMTNVAQSSQQQTTPPPPPFDIYSTSCPKEELENNNNNNSNNSNSNNNNGFDLNSIELNIEDQHKSFVTIAEQIMAKIWSDTLPEQSDIQQLLELLKFDFGRKMFGQLLLKANKPTSPSSSDSNSNGNSNSTTISPTTSPASNSSTPPASSNTSTSPTTSPNNTPTTITTMKTKLNDQLFICLGDILKAALREANLHSDFQSTRMYLEASFTYHRLQKGSNEFVSERIRNQDVWQNYKFWEQFFFDSIESRCKSMYGNIVRELISWSSYTPKQQENLMVEERDMEFSLLSKMVYYMINLGSRPDLVRRFVNKMCSGISFDIERTETMMQVVSNITRARDMYDFDYEDPESVATEGEKHVDKDVKLQFTKESYIPIGLYSPQAHEGRVLLNHLIDEKSTSLVALRSISRIMNLKNQWNEKRSTTKDRIDYRDVGENRGDYVVKTFAGHQEGVLCVALANASPSTTGREGGSVLVTGSADSTLRIWDITTTRCLGVLEDHGGWVTSCDIVNSTGSDSKVISGSYDKSLKLWDIHKCAKIKSFRGHKGSISCLQSIDSHQIVSGSYDNTIYIWDDRSAKPSSVLTGHQQPIMSIICEGYNIISASRDTNIRVWDSRTLSSRILSGHTDWVKCLEYDGSDLLLSGSCDGRVKVWSITNGECIKTLQGHSGSINSILLHEKKELMNDGLQSSSATKKFVTASADSSIKVWDSNYAESYHTLSGHTDEVMAVSQFVNNLVVSGSYDGTVKLWDIESGKTQRTIHNHAHRISSLKTYDSLIVTGSWDKTAKVLQIEY